MVAEKEDRPRGVTRPDETDRRDAARDQDELDLARGRLQERRKDLLPGTRAWRTDHTEVMLVEDPGPGESEVYLRVTDITTGRYVQAPLTADDLEIVAHILQLHATRLRRLEERR
jgi:hypothetical protein